jgi:hypothetical protein
MEKLEKLDLCAFWKMEPCMKVSGCKMKIKKTEEVCKYGQMVQDMMDSGKMELLKDTEGWFMPRETYMKVNGWMTKLMVMVSTLTLMEASMKVNGLMISNMDLESKDGQMVLSMKEHMSLE